MKKAILLSLSMLIVGICFSQTAEELDKKADSFYKAKDYHNASIYYSKAAQLTDPTQIVELNTRRWGAAEGWAMRGKADSAFKYLATVASSKGLTFGFFLDLVADEDLNTLKTDKRWGEFRKQLFFTANQSFQLSRNKSKDPIPNWQFIEPALAWSIFNKDSAFAMLDQIVKSKNISISIYNSIKNSQLLNSLKTDNRWIPILEALYSKAENFFSTPLDESYTQEEIIYGRREGMALTMMHLKPKRNAKHRTVIQVISSSWRSSLYGWDVFSSLPYIHAGYDVFVVMHASAPVYSFPDALNDLQKAIRFIRYHAKAYDIDPEKLGITGRSAGGHLSLLCGMINIAPDLNSGDPLDRVSSKVQAVACYYPPSDFINWSSSQQTILNSSIARSSAFNHLFEFRKWNLQRQFSYIVDSTEIDKILKDHSPINYVAADNAPILIIHGDKDPLVPIDQSYVFVKALEKNQVPVSLSVKNGGGHGWEITKEESKMFVDWFDKYLK